MFSSYVTNPNLNKFNYTSSFMYEAEFLIKFIILSLLTFVYNYTFIGFNSESIISDSLIFIN